MILQSPTQKTEKGDDIVRAVYDEKDLQEKADIAVLELDHDASDEELPKLDRFARRVTNWITQRGLEGHGCVIHDLSLNHQWPAIKADATSCSWPTGSNLSQ